MNVVYCLLAIYAVLLFSLTMYFLFVGGAQSSLPTKLSRGVVTIASGECGWAA